MTVVVPADSEVLFRYLGHNGQWFDDPDADEITADGSILRPATEPTSSDDNARASDRAELPNAGN